MSYTHVRGNVSNVEKSKAFVVDLTSDSFDMKLKKGEVFRYQGALVKVESIASIEVINGVIVVRGKCKQLPRKEPS